MANEPLDADDLRILHRVLDQQPDLGEMIALVKRIVKQARFPVASFEELAGVLGGEDAAVQLHGQAVRVGDLRAGLPAYYFPIESEDDLIAKLGDLMSRAGGQVPPPQGVAQGKQVPLPEGLRPPDLPVPPRPPGVNYLGERSAK